VVFPRGYVEDVAAAITLAVTDSRAAGRVYNVAEQQAVPETRWVRRIGDVLGWEDEVVALPPERLPEQLRSALDPDQPLSIDSARIRRELGYGEVVPADVALRRTVTWELAHPPEPLDPRHFDYEAEDAALSARSSPTQPSRVIYSPGARAISKRQATTIIS